MATQTHFQGDPTARRRRWLNPRWLILAALPLVALSAGVASAASATSPSDAPGSPQDAPRWVLDHFEVVIKEEDTETSREPKADPKIREFRWTGEHEYGSTYPGGTLSVEATLSFDLPTEIRPDTPFFAKVSAKGSVDTPGRQGLHAALMSVFGECMDTQLWPRSQCQGTFKSQYIDDIAGKSIDMVANAPQFTVTVPSAMATAGENFFIRLRGGIGTTTPGDPYWRIFVYAYYSMPSSGGNFDLSLDSDIQRMPPSGSQSSVANLTAAIHGPDGKPVAGEAIAFTLDPADLGQLAPLSGVTNGQGEVKARYVAPTVPGLKGRDHVDISARNATHKLERGLSLGIARYRMRLTADTTVLKVANPPPAAKVRVLVEDFNGAGVTGDTVRFTLDPPDMGTIYGDTLNGNQAVTQGGVIEFFYEAPPADQLRGRDQVTLRATNVTHAADEGISFRLAGLHVVRTFPEMDAKDVILEPGDTIDIECDQPLDSASLTPDTVIVETQFHGRLAGKPEIFGRSIQFRLPEEPIPDIGLVITLRLKGGAGGLRAKDGSLLLAPYTLYFQTMPKLSPEMVISQVVDDPHDALLPFRILVAKPFLVRLLAGLSEETELSEEQVAVKLMGPVAGREKTMVHTFYPGRWSARVPQAAIETGNSANFVIRKPFPVGQYVFDAELRPYFAPDDKKLKVHADDINMNRYESQKTRFLGIQAIQVTNTLVARPDWPGDGYAVREWLDRVATEAEAMLPTERLSIKLGQPVDTNCHSYGGSGIQCDDKQPWTHFQYWVRHVGRIGMFTRRYSYIVALTPPGWMDTLYENPEVEDHPELYHDMAISKVWSYRYFSSTEPPSPAAEVSLVETGAPAGSLIHALGDADGLPHSKASRDPLRGYDLHKDRLIYSDEDRWMGAYLSIMSEHVGSAPSWPSVSDYEHFLHKWSNRCFGLPCPSEPPAPLANSSPNSPQFAGDAAHPDQGQDPAEPLFGVSGVIRIDGSKESGGLDPLLRVDGTPSLAPGGTGDYAIEVLDAQGGRLARYAFTPQFGPISGGKLAGFLYSVPRPANAAAVALVHGQSTITKLARSAHAPAVAFTKPAAGGRFQGAVSAEWRGTDADGDALTYQLLFTGDGGETWEPLLVDSTEVRHTLPSDRMANGQDSRLRVIASDGFDSTEATLAFGLNNPLVALSHRPPSDAVDVAVNTPIEVVLRDPLDPASLTASTFSVTDAQGSPVAGSVTYLPLDYSILFYPDDELGPGHTYTVRLARSIRTPDGRTLAADLVWRFTTRGHRSFLPVVARAWDLRAAPRRLPTARPSPTFRETPLPPATRTPTPAGRASPTPRSEATITFTPDTGPPRPQTATPTGAIAPTDQPTPNLVATAVAATLTARAPGATATSTADLIGTAVAGTRTALAPSPTGAVSTPGPTATIPAPTSTRMPTSAIPTTAPTPTSALASVGMDAISSTNEDASHIRMVFVALDTIQLWMRAQNTSGSAQTVQVAFAVNGPGGLAPATLNWSGPFDVAPGETWIRLQRTVPTGLASGDYTYTASLTFAGRTASLSSEIVFANSLAFADEFGDASSGWLEDATTDSDSGYLEGEYRIRVHRPDRWRWSAAPTLSPGANYAIEADTRSVGTTTGAAAIVFGLDPAADTFYLLEITPTGTYSVYRRVAGTWQTLVEPIASPNLRTGAATNHIAVWNRNGWVTFFGNGQVLTSIVDLAGTAGRVGLYASDSQSGTDVRFDRFRVSRTER